MRIDVSAFLGEYPFRRVGGGPEPLLAAMDRVGTDQAWVSHVGAVFWRDPTEGNPVLYDAAFRSERLRPVPAAHPGLANWRDVLGEAVAWRAPAVRADPHFYGIEPAGADMRRLAAGSADAGLPLLLAVRLEDLRQRHPNDGAAELTPAELRALIRCHPALRLIVTHADRECIEQVHFGSTMQEAGRILWDISWVWGPPEDHLALLLLTVGRERFTFGTGMPLRIPEVGVARLDLLDLDPAGREALESGNLRTFLST